MKNLKALVLFVLLVSVMALCFTSCGTPDKNPGEHQHSFSEATCTAPKTCECGATEGAALGHKSVVDAASDPTCTEDGATEGSHCSVCNEVITAQTVIPATGHTHDTVVTLPTCTEKGYTTYTCACGDSYVADEVAAKGHAHSTTVTAPTCTEKGFTTYTCACGDSYVADEVAAKGHAHSTAVTAPTCTEKGFTTYTCACGDSYVADDVAALGHSYGSVTTAPTCEDEGYTTYTCARCKDSYTDNKLSALGHTFIDGKCECGGVYVPAPATGDWALVTELKNGDHVLIGAPAYGKLLSAKKTGYYNVGVNYSATDFSSVTDSEIFVVTVNSDGSYTFTSLTGDVIALADSYSSLNVDGNHKSWTLKEKDNGRFHLYNTGRKTYLEWYASKNNWSTYTNASTDEYLISFYAKSAGSDENHVHNHITSTVAPTCEEEGYTSYTCACGDSYKKNIVSATGHSYTPSVVEPTCEEGGYTNYLCSCGEGYKENEVAALGHSYTDGVCSVCQKEDPDYVKPIPGGMADLDTIVLPSSKPNGDSSYTETYSTTNGWTSVNSAIQTGGSTDMNPQFTVIGPDNTHKAVCLNGKTSAPGKLTSPTITTGISKLTVNYTKIFTDTELSVTVTITDAAGNKYTHVIAQTLPKNEKYVVYTDVWTLETPVSGDFTIEIVNNCPSGNNSNKDRFTVLDVIWEGAAAPHVHEYTSTTTATCTEAGTTTYTCECGDSYTEEVDKLGHIDENLDVSCDRENCSGKVAPPADTVLSNFTANNLGSKLSTSASYYVVGTIVEVIDAKNGIFYIDDGSGEYFYFRLPKDADGNSYSAWTSGKIVLGDKVQVYGKINKYSSTSAPNGSFWPAIQSGLVTVLEHTHAFSEPTCTEDGVCGCLAVGESALGHTDTDGNNACDRCEWNMKHKVETVKTQYNSIKGTEDATTDRYIFRGEKFNMTVEKGSSTLNTNGTNYVRIQNLNNVVIGSLNGEKIVSITFVTTGDSYVDELQLFLESAGYTIETNGLEVTVKIDSLELVTLSNTSKKVARIAEIIVVYEVSVAA